MYSSLEPISILSVMAEVSWGALPLALSQPLEFPGLINKSDTHISSRESDSEEYLLTHEKQFLLEWYFNQNWSRMTWPGPWIWADIKSVEGAVAVSQFELTAVCTTQLLTQGSLSQCSCHHIPCGLCATGQGTPLPELWPAIRTLLFRGHQIPQDDPLSLHPGVILADLQN